MDNVTIGLWVTSGMLVLVFFGMRVAFAAAAAFSAAAFSAAAFSAAFFFSLFNLSRFF